MSPLVPLPIKRIQNNVSSTVTINNGDLHVNHTKVIGNNNDIIGDNNQVIGNNNDITGDGNQIIGNNNDAYGYNNVMTGNNNDSHESKLPTVNPNKVFSVPKPPPSRILHEPGFFQKTKKLISPKEAMSEYKRVGQRCPIDCIFLNTNEIIGTDKIQYVCEKHKYISEIDTELSKYTVDCGYEFKPKHKWGVGKFNLSDEEYKELELLMSKFENYG